MKKIILVVLSIFTLFSFAGEKLETNTFKDIEKKALEYGKKYQPQNVLIAIDIDNTLLTMPQSLGSDQWFNWQYNNCIGKKKLPDYCITDNMGKFLDLVGRIFANSNMIPSDEHIVNVVQNLQSKGFKVILLTSRGSEFRDATQRAIKKNGMDFTKSAIGPKGGYAATYRPYEIKKLKKYGITKDEATVAKLKKPRQVSYQNGLFMGSGQHKGIMLKTLLAKTKAQIKAIVFTDDHEKHTSRMQAIFGKSKEIELSTFRYGKIDPQVKTFNESDKKKVISDYNLFQTTMDKIYL